MTKQLYEDALADVKRVKEVAEDNAKRAIIEAVTPRVKELIERELLSEAADDDDLGAPGSMPVDGELMTDLVAPEADGGATAAAITPPDAEGKVTLDLDALATGATSTAVPPPQFGEPTPDEYEVSMEGVNALSPVLEATKVREVTKRVERLNQATKKLTNLHMEGRRSNSHLSQITQMISRVEDMYVYVQGSVVDTAAKASFDAKLESCYQQLNKLQEQTEMSKNKQQRMTEADVNLTLTGLPDDIDLDAIGVDLVTGEEDAEDGAGDELEGGDDLGGEGGDDLGLDDLGGEGGEEEDMGEAAELSDDTVVEIDEGMLRREILKMRKLREDAKVWDAGEGVDAKAMDDFGGGSDDGEAFLDGEVTTEADGAMDEADDMSEADDALPMESLKRRLSFEKRLQERARTRAKQIKKEAAAARSRRDSKSFTRLTSEFKTVNQRFVESKEREKKISKRLAESATPRSQARQNGMSTRPAEQAVNNLRKKLAETNLTNAKLLYTNKLLQNESLSAKQKADIIEQLDGATTLGEARRVYQSLSTVLAGGAKSRVTEGTDRKVIGSASRTTRPASTQTLNEGIEAERWAKLAGITK